MNSKNCVFTLLVFLSTFSCRTTIENEKIEPENRSSNNIAFVSVKASSIEWEAPKTYASYNQPSIQRSLETNYRLYDDTKETEVLEETKSVRSLLLSGAKYIVQAFDYNTGQLVDWKVSTIGLSPEPLKLNAGKNYDIVIYSFNSSEIPSKVSSINDKISYDYTDNTKEFLYHKISNYSPNSGNNELIDVVLKNKFSYAKFILDTKNLSTYNDKEISISGIPKLSNVHFKSGKISVINGNFLGDNFIDLSFPMRYVDKGIHKSDYIPIILESGNSQATFTTDIIAHAKHGDEKKTKNILVNIKSGTKKEYTIKINGAVNIPKPRVLMSSVASDIVVSGCPKSGRWSTPPCDKKTSTFNIYVDITDFDASRYSVSSTIEGFVSPDIRTKSFGRTNTEGSHFWAIEYIALGGSMNNIGGEIYFRIRVYDNILKRVVASGQKTTFFCKIENSDGNGKCLR